MTVSELARTLSLECIHPGDQERTVTGAYAGDLLSWVMGRAQAGEAWITIMSNLNVASVASLVDLSCIILAEDVEPDEGLRSKFAQIDAAVYRSPLNAYELSWRLHQALDGN